MIRRKLFSKRSRKTSFLFIIIGMLLIPFQNCKKFESNEPLVEESSTMSSTSSTSGNNDSGGLSTPGGSPSDGSLTDDPAAIAAENARQERCRNNIKKPVITNAGSINNFVFNLKSGLDGNAGDKNASENKDIIIDSSKGIIDTSLTTPQTSGGDGCSYVTTIRINSVNNSSYTSTLDNAITFSGTNAVTGNTSTDFSNLSKAVSTNPNNNNNNTFASNTLNLKMTITNNNNRTLRCVQGTVWYQIKVRVSTQSLNNNAQLESDPVFVKANVENACWTEQKLKASADYPLNAKVGSHVVMDGIWAAALSSSDNNKGAVFVFKKDGSGNWNYSQKLVMSDAATGNNLSNLSLKGNILAVSNASYGTKGKVYIFKNSNSVWTESQQINAYENTVLYQQFGLGLALDNNVLAVGAPSLPISNAVGSDVGKVYIYTYDAGSGQFIYSQALQGSNEANFGFGRKILISGTKMFIGAPDATNGSPGSVFVFNKSSLWGQEMVITAPTGTKAGAGFGSSIAYNGTALAVGAPLNDKDSTTLDIGSVFYYKSYNSSVFHTMSGAGSNFKFGMSLAFSSNSLFIGCTGCGGNQSGVVYRKLISNVESDTASNRNINSFINFSQDNTNTESYGQSIVSDGGSTLMVGAPSKDTPNLKSGAAYMYLVR